jgi:hypothetical protein
MSADENTFEPQYQAERRPFSVHVATRTNF